MCDHIHDWWFGTKPGQVVSMAVNSTGNTYGIADGIVFSFPCECKDGQWKIVKGYKIDDFSSEKLKKTETELLGERKVALGY